MLEIKPCTDMKKIAEFCKKCDRQPSEAFYLYLAVNNREQIAASFFEVTSDAVSALHYEALDENDYWLFDGMLRSGFNYAFEQGILQGVIPEAFRIKYQRFFAKLNYPIQSEFDITNFFKKYKNCK